MNEYPYGSMGDEFKELAKAFEQASESLKELCNAAEEVQEEPEYKFDPTPYKPKTKPMAIKRKKPWQQFYRRS